MILYIETPTVSNKKLFDLVSEFGKIVRYKVNIQKSMAPTMNYQNEKLRKKISFTIAARKIKYLGVHLTKE